MRNILIYFRSGNNESFENENKPYPTVEWKDGHVKIVEKPGEVYIYNADTVTRVKIVDTNG